MLVIDVHRDDNEPVTLSDLLEAAEFLDDRGEGVEIFLNVVSTMSLNQIQPFQGEEEFGEYEGQPVVWDGYWEWRKTDNPENVYGGNLYYCGNTGPSGEGPAVERMIGLDDEIIFW